jgi:hypothetical protein
MKLFLRSILPITVLCGAFLLNAAQPTPALQALDDLLPGSLINDPTRLDWAVYGPGASSKTIKDDKIPGGKAALQVTVPKAGATLYEVGTNAPITAAIAPRADLVVAFYARTVSSGRSDGNGIIGVRFQQNAAPYPGFGDTTMVIGKEWQLYEVSARSNMAVPAGEGVVAFQLAGAKQVIQIGQTFVVSGVKSLRSPTGGLQQQALLDLPAQLQGKGTLISDLANKQWPVFGTAGTSKVVPAPGIPGSGGSALQVTTKAATANPFDVGLLVPVTGNVAEGDVLLIGVLVRTAPGSSGDGIGKVGIRVQLNQAPYPGFGDNVLTVGPNWKLIQLRTQAKIALPAGKGAVALHFGSAAQSIEVGQVFVINTSVPAPPAAN